jgi:hypothetical protein
VPRKGEHAPPKAGEQLPTMWGADQSSNLANFENVPQEAGHFQKCTLWNDIRTYLTRNIDSKEKTSLLVAINYFKNKEID